MNTRVDVAAPMVETPVDATRLKQTARLAGLAYLGLAIFARWFSAQLPDHSCVEPGARLSWCPRDELLAEAEDADLLVVGSHGRSAVGRMVLGSVSNSLVEHPPCPVAFIRAPFVDA